MDKLTPEQRHRNMQNIKAKDTSIECILISGCRCHDNARCESMWARLKEELFHGRYNTKKMKGCLP